MAYRAASVTTAGDAASTSLVIARPAGAATDDILIIYFYAEDTTLIPTASPGTWASIPAAQGEQTIGTPDFETFMLWSRQGAEAGNITVAWGGASVWNVGIAAAYTGRIASGDPQDATGLFTSGNSATVSCGGVTTAHDNADIVCAGGSAAGATYVWTGATERSDFGGSSLSDTIQVSAGATGAKTAAVSSTPWTGQMIALRLNLACTLTGTVTSAITETDIVTGGKTIILTLTGDTWIVN